MDKISSLKSLETMFNALSFVLNIFLEIARFLFLTPWGWIILLVVFLTGVVFKARNHRDEVTMAGFFGSLAESFLQLYSNFMMITIGIAMLFFLNILSGTVQDAAKSLSLFREIKTLEAVLKNLKTDRKLADVTISNVKEDDKVKLSIRIKYYSYSPVKDQDVFTGDAAYTLEGNKAYLNFGVLNFDYSLVEKGLLKNVAFPNRVYSDTVSYDSGTDILARNNGFPLSFQLDGKDIYILDEKTYQDEMLSIFSALTNEETARKIGLRTTYGEAFALAPNANRTYSFYSTATGGVIFR